jgi:hypothetical protein
LSSMNESKIGGLLKWKPKGRGLWIFPRMRHRKWQSSDGVDMKHG